MRKSTALGFVTLLACSFMSTITAAETAPVDNSPANVPAIHSKFTPPGFIKLANEKRMMASAAAREINPADLVRQLKENNGSVSVANVLKDVKGLSNSFVNQAQSAERSILSKKGVRTKGETLLELRIAAPQMMSQLQEGVEPLYAYEPDGDESTWQYIEAYDSNGGLHLLDVWSMPERPVVVVDINAKKDMQLGLAQMREVFSRSASKSIQINKAQSDSINVTILDSIRLGDDEEPWISGNAEVYAIVTGVDPSRDEPALDIVDMPYLDEDGKTYYPNQVVVYWDRYRWGAANIILMEHDDNTNYQTLAQKLLTTAAQVLSALGQPEIGALVALGSGIVELMPEHWFSNDDDYLDSFYTLEKSMHYGNHMGVSGNAMTTMRPYTLNGIK
ncbi:conserved hypothetical protein [Hahella chejuensis KCTC 2396]|uniref:DUF3103 domain-containing protein n=1 Tax=Hahella chejuensis (strain KCTC 2396) TaxID=349521 RepID=Q2SJI2_HAHCH|nr:DUF3103 domain-containing protein [Hahella chejuensis]ABC29192.1 conserved hypothetical protein [Hahella chejuensis KCTC 2396]